MSLNTVMLRYYQSQAQNFSSSLSAVGCRERLPGNGIFLIFFEFFHCCLQNNNQSKKFKNYSKKFHYPRISPGNQPLTKKPEDPQLEIKIFQESKDFCSKIDKIGTKTRKLSQRIKVGKISEQVWFYKFS